MSKVDLEPLPMQQLTRAAVAVLPGSAGTNAEIHAGVLALLPEDVRNRIESDPEVAQSFYDRLAAAKSNLKKAGLLVNHSRGLWRLGDPHKIISHKALPAPKPSRTLAKIWGDLPPPSRSSGLELRGLRNAELVALYPQVAAELRRRKIIRTMNLVGEFAERLAADALGGRLATAAQKGWDVELPDHRRIQVKARTVTDPTNNGQRQLGVIRVKDGQDIADSFHELCIVLFDGRLQVGRAVLLPVDVVRDLLGPLVAHVNGRTVFATDAVMFHPEVKDVTPAFRAAADSLDRTAEWPSAIQLSQLR